MADEQSRIDQAVGRAIRDRAFRKKLAANPKDALKELNIPDTELDQIAGGLRSQVMWSSEKKCYESG